MTAITHTTFKTQKQVIFCELVNSMFGSLKFRQIRSLCKCCKLHSITRRTLRFSGAYLLGFLIVMISCDILATSAGKFRPYFAQECPTIYDACFRSSPSLDQPISSPIRARELDALEQQTSLSSTAVPSLGLVVEPTSDTASQKQLAASTIAIRPLSPPISSATNNSTENINQQPMAGDSVMVGEGGALRRTRREAKTQVIDRSVIERKWIDLSNANLKQLCQMSGDHIQTRKFDSIAMSWPSFPGAVFTYACFYLACYLSFVGTARPFRLITSVLVMILLLASTIFNVQLVKEHYNHWEDVAGGAALSLVVTLFVLLVYLNKFRDTHYYENQKLYGSASRRQQQLRRSLMMMGADGSPYKGHSNEVGQYQLDKVDSGHLSGGASAPVVHNLPNGNEASASGPASVNDLAMRYFQIPRANYRGAPRPLSSMNRT